MYSISCSSCTAISLYNGCADVSSVIGDVTSHHTFKTAASPDVHTKWRRVLEFIMTEEAPPVDIHKHLKNVYGNSTIDMSIVGWANRRRRQASKWSTDNHSETGKQESD